MRILRPEQRIYTIGDPGLRIENALASALAPWWEVPGKTCVAAYQPKGAASYAASKINLANPGTYDATEGVAPTWSEATGWTFNGTSQYLMTGLISGDVSWSYFVQFAECPITGSWVCTLLGARQEVPRRIVWLQPYPAASVRQYRHGSQYYLNIAPPVASGNMGMAGSRGYLDGTDCGLVPTGTLPSVALYLGAYNYNGTAAGYFFGNIQAIAIYSAELDALQAAILSAAMAAL